MSRAAIPSPLDLLRRTARSTKLVLRSPRWLLAAVVVFLSVLTTITVGNSPTYVERVVIGGDLSILDRLFALWSIVPTPGTSPHPAAIVVLYVFAAVVGLGFVTILYYVTHREEVRRE